MTLYELVKQIEEVASAQPSVRLIVENDIYKLNDCADALYGVFAFTQNEHSTSAESDVITYNFTLFYVDRLLDDESNLIEVQSTAIQVLDNILSFLNDGGVAVGDYTFQPFNQRFADICAGVYTNVALSVAKDGDCAEDFDKKEVKVI